MRDRDIGTVLDRIARFVPRFDDQPSVGQVAEQTHDPFLVLVATLISLRTREEVTRAVMWRLFDLARTPAEMAALPVETIRRAIVPALYAHGKARTIQTVAAEIVEKHEGRVPD